MEVLVTGGAGFIGSTVASAAIDAGHHPVLLDDLSSGRAEFTRGRTFYRGDIADADLVERILDEHPGIEAVVHCAARIVVPESVADPAGYYRTNVAKTLDLVEVLARRGVHDVVFSSSASVYAPDDDLTVDEHSRVAPGNPYARSKLMVEQILADVAAAGGPRALSLRYFNPIGADPRLRTGPQAPAPSHVLGRLVAAHATRRPFTLTGTDYPTRDGSGLRDYVHVWDLARAHVAALENLDRALEGGRNGVINLGTGHGTTVRELVAAFGGVVGRELPVVEAPRRPGDAAGACTRSDKAKRLLDWTPEASLADGIADTLAWFDHRTRILPDLAA